MARKVRLLSVVDRARDAWRGAPWRSWARTRKVRLTRAGRLAVVAAVVPWLVGYVIAGRVFYVFAYGTVFLVGVSFLLAPRGVRLEGTRAGLRPRVQEGERLDVDVRLTARRAISTFLLEERVPDRLGGPVRVPVTKAPRGAEIAHSYSVRFDRRGVYEIGPLVALTGDPLGLSLRETVVADRFELLVHPRIERVADRVLTRRYEDPPVRPPVSKPWPTGLEFYGMREFRPGDELRRIVWRASARMGKLMVREAEEGITDQITIVLDTDRGSHTWEGDGSESFETAVRAAASIALKHLRDGYEVRVESNAGRLVRTLRGAGCALELLDAFARVEMSREPLVSVIRRLIAEPRRDAHTILITPHLGDTEAAQLRLVLDRGASIVVLALLWDEEDQRTLNVAAALGCQVAGIRPGHDLATALSHGVGAGTR